MNMCVGRNLWFLLFLISTLLLLSSSSHIQNIALRVHYKERRQIHIPHNKIFSQTGAVEWKLYNNRRKKLRLGLSIFSLFL